MAKTTPEIQKDVNDRLAAARDAYTPTTRFVELEEKFRNEAMQRTVAEHYSRLFTEAVGTANYDDFVEAVQALKYLHSSKAGVAQLQLEGNFENFDFTDANKNGIQYLLNLMHGLCQAFDDDSVRASYITSEQVQTHYKMLKYLSDEGFFSDLIRVTREHYALDRLTSGRTLSQVLTLVRGLNPDAKHGPISPSAVSFLSQAPAIPHVFTFTAPAALGLIKRIA